MYLIFGGNYSFIFNNQKIKKIDRLLFLRVNAEAAGNMLEVAENLTGAKTDGAIIFWVSHLHQYVRSDMDLRYNSFLNDG